jgi:hypothetical protein
MQANLVEIETDVVLMLVLPTGGSAPTSTKPFHTGGYPIRLSGLSRQPSNEKGAQDVGLVSEASCATEVRH